MSAILDALRRIQRERERKQQPVDLRESIAAAPPPAARGGLRLWFVLGIVVLGVGGAGAYLWLEPGADTPATAAQQSSPAIARQTRPSAPPAETASATRRSSPARVRPTARPERDSAAPSAVIPEPASLAALRRPSAGPLPGSPAEVLPRPTTPVPPAKPPQPGASGAKVALAQIPSPSTEPEAERSAAPQPRPRPRPAAVRPGPKAEVVARAPKAAPAVTPEPSKPARPAPRSTSSNETPAAASEAEDPPPFQVFPRIDVKSIRWHPDPSRRAARLIFEQMREIDAREGDIIIGVSIHRIDPGAVELRSGTARRLIRIGQ